MSTLPITKNHVRSKQIYSKNYDFTKNIIILTAIAIPIITTAFAYIGAFKFLKLQIINPKFTFTLKIIVPAMLGSSIALIELSLYFYISRRNFQKKIDYLLKNVEEPPSDSSNDEEFIDESIISSTSKVRSNRIERKALLPKETSGEKDDIDLNSISFEPSLPDKLPPEVTSNRIEIEVALPKEPSDEKDDINLNSIPFEPSLLDKPAIAEVTSNSIEIKAVPQKEPSDEDDSDLDPISSESSFDKSVLPTPKIVYEELSRQEIEENKPIIKELLEALADYKKTYLWWHQEYYKSLAQKIKIIHPLKLLEYLINDPEMKAFLEKIIERFPDKLNETIDNDRDDIMEYLDDFAIVLSIEKSNIEGFFIEEEIDWKDLVIFLLKLNP